MYQETSLTVHSSRAVDFFPCVSGYRLPYLQISIASKSENHAKLLLSYCAIHDWVNLIKWYSNKSFPLYLEPHDGFEKSSERLEHLLHNINVLLRYSSLNREHCIVCCMKFSYQRFAFLCKCVQNWCYCHEHFRLVFIFV